MLERLAVRHQSGGGQNAVAVRFDDAFVDIARKAEIVGVDDQPDAARHAKTSASLMRQELLRVGAHVLDQAVHFPRGPFSES